LLYTTGYELFIIASLQSESGGKSVYICNYLLWIYLLLYVNYIEYFRLVTIVTLVICLTFVNYLRLYLISSPGPVFL